MKVVFDLEATCWSTPRPTTDIETIEIGAVKLDRDSSVIGTFSRFVQPVKFPILDEFCKGLTGIKQKDVDNAQRFPEAFRDFLMWAWEVDHTHVQFLTWGKFDMRQITQDMNYHSVDFVDAETLRRRHIDLQKVFCRQRKIRRCSVSNALQFLGKTFSGKLHRAIDDAKNTAVVAQHFYEYDERDILIALERMSPSEIVYTG